MEELRRASPIAPPIPRLPRPRTDFLPLASVAPELEELRDSHAALLRHVTDLSSDLAETKRKVAKTDRSVHGPVPAPDNAYLRAVLFAGVSASKLLSGINVEFSKFYSTLCSANSVRQIVLKSKGSDCTLEDFRMIVSRCTREDIGSTCEIVPSTYQAMFSRSKTAVRMEIKFSDYRGICDALNLPADIREAGIYREKKNRLRAVRTVQVIGVALETENVRKIALGHCMLTTRRVPSQTVMHIMHQPDLVWVDGAWNSGFSYVPEPEHEFEQWRKGVPEIPNASFRLTWERCLPSHSPYPRDSSPQLVPGSLHCFFPAVVIRGRTLTASVQDMFNTTHQGNLLKTILSSPRQFGPEITR